MTDVRYPSEDQQGRFVPEVEGAYSPYDSSGSPQGGYDHGYDQAPGYAADMYSSGGYAAVDASGTWSTPAPSYDAYGTQYQQYEPTPGYDAYGPPAQEMQSDVYGGGTYDGYDASGSFQASVPFQASGSFDPSGSFDQSASFQASGSFDVSGSYGAVQDGGVYGAYGAQTQTQTWVGDTSAQSAPDVPYVDSWGGTSNTEMWYAASDTAAWESDTWLAPIPVRDDADMWSGGNRSSVDLFDDGSTPAPVEPAFDLGEYDISVPARTDIADDEDDEDDRPDTAAADAQPLPTADKARAKRKPKPTRRSFPLTAGAPLAVMGAAAMAVAAVGGLHTAGAETKDADPLAGAGGEDLPLMSPMDKQLVDLQVGAEDFAERASRAQTRISLQERQEEAQQAQEEAQRAQEAERKRKEDLRPKYVLPVAQKGLSAYFGSSGSRWANTHTGIDFPVDLGTPVLAVMDGVVRTQSHSAYGNMVILTAKDGTETWYCHLTRAKIRSGPVKAGDVIGYSGDTGNVTGPHLHFEVRPDGGAPINPLSWLRAKGLDPT
ncbi:M23 family metallopeptidase [Embleya sp. NBC_00896]|uniref:M23 family metallopeptidase n=1 Tax=Embleya sp. NBC_00896 TaxID=2975961 RepID=UPI003869CAC1